MTCAVHSSCCYLLLRLHQSPSSTAHLRWFMIPLNSVMYLWWHCGSTCSPANFCRTMVLLASLRWANSVIFFSNGRVSSYNRSCETSFLDSGLASPKTVSLSRPTWKYVTIPFCHLDNLIIFVSFPVLCHITNAVERFFHKRREKEIERYRCWWHCIFVVRQNFAPTCYQFSAHKKKKVFRYSGGSRIFALNLRTVVQIIQILVLTPD